MRDPVGRGPFFKIEEHTVKSEEEGRDRRREPAESRITEGRSIDPGSLGHPLLRLSECMGRVRSCKQHCCETCNGYDDGDISDGVVEPLRGDKEAKHDWQSKPSYEIVSTDCH